MDAERPEWDVFVSFSSVHRHSVAIPIATALRQSGLRVWLDDFEVRVGDSIRAAIERGLAKSRLVIALIGTEYLEGTWTERELSGIFARESSRRKILLPVLVGIAPSELAFVSPMLAGRRCAMLPDPSRVAGGELLAALRTVTTELCAEIFRVLHDEGLIILDNSDSQQRDMLSDLTTLLEGKSDMLALRHFLLQHEIIPRGLCGVRTHWAINMTDADADGPQRIGSTPVDIVICGMHEYSGSSMLSGIVLLSPDTNPVIGSSLAADVQDLVDSLEHDLLMIRDRETANSWVNQIPFEWWSSDGPLGAREVEGIVLVGRRRNQTKADKQVISTFNQMERCVKVIAYDRLIDLARTLPAISDWQRKQPYWSAWAPKSRSRD